MAFAQVVEMSVANNSLNSPSHDSAEDHFQSRHFNNGKKLMVDSQTGILTSVVFVFFFKILVDSSIKF